MIDEKNRQFPILTLAATIPQPSEKVNDYGRCSGEAQNLNPLRSCDFSGAIPWVWTLLSIRQRSGDALGPSSFFPDLRMAGGICV